MAEARHGIRLAEPLNHWLRKSFDSSVGLTAGDLVLLADCMVAIETVSRNLDEQTGFFVVRRPRRNWSSAFPRRSWTAGLRTRRN